MRNKVTLLFSILFCSSDELNQSKNALVATLSGQVVIITAIPPSQSQKLAN